MPSFDFMAVHADRWTRLLPKLTAAGKDGYHVVGFLSEGGCYSALMERGEAQEITCTIPPESLLQMQSNDIEDRPIPEFAKNWARVSPVAVGPRETVYRKEMHGPRYRPPPCESNKEV